MITEAYDSCPEAIINPGVNPDAPAVDACILTFSHVIERRVAERFACEPIATLWAATGATPIYRFGYQGKTFAFFKTFIGAPACVGSVEESLAYIRTKRYVVFGGAGCLDKQIAHGKVMVPTEAYRDEGTSYHYAPAADYVRVRNADAVADFLRARGIPYARGKTWTTDSFYRETVRNFQRRKADGCISVEMECAGLQAMCDFRGLELYTFFTSGDLLDAPEWDVRHAPDEWTGTQHDARHFDIALALARHICDR